MVYAHVPQTNTSAKTINVYQSLQKNLMESNVRTVFVKIKWRYWTNGSAMFVSLSHTNM